MKIYTKTGDKGETSLFTGLRVAKDSLRVDTYGSVDELNSIIGIARSFQPKEPLAEDLERISNLLFIAGSDFATPLEPMPKFEITRISANHFEWLESRIDEYDKILPPLKEFILPGGAKTAAFLHQARTVCRRAERLAVSLAREANLGEHLVIFFNRLSDYLFTAARLANLLDGIDDKIRNKDI